MGLLKLALVSVLLTLTRAGNENHESGLFLNGDDVMLNGAAVDTISGVNPVQTAIPGFQTMQFRFFGSAVTTAWIAPNGFVAFNSYAVTNPSDLTDVNAASSINRKLISPYMIPSVTPDVERSYSYRLINCPVQEERNRVCSRAAGIINNHRDVDPYDPAESFKIAHLAVITWRYLDLTQPALPNLTKTQLLLITGTVPDSAILKSYAVFVYADPASTFHRQLPAYEIVTVANEGVVGANKQFNLCENNAVLTGGLFNDLTTRTYAKCNKPGIYVVEFTNDPLPPAPGRYCFNTVVPQDSCTMAPYCRRSESNQWQMSIRFRFPRDTDRTVVSVESDFATEAANCVQQTLPANTGSTMAFLDFNPFQVAAPCGALVNADPFSPDFGSIQWRFKVVDEVGVKQHGDVYVTARCNVNDLPDTATTFITVGDVGMVEAPKSGREVKFYLADSSGPGALPISDGFCDVREFVIFRIEFIPGINYDSTLDLYAVRVLSCEASNNADFLVGGSVPTYNMDGTPRGTFTAGVVTEFVTDGCVNEQIYNADLAFRLGPDTISRKGFRVFPGTQPGNTWILEAPRMKCASFKHTQRVWYRCFVEYCGPLDFNGIECSDSCPSLNRRRRQAGQFSEAGAKPGTELTTSVTVRLTPEPSLPSDGEIECVGHTVAIATLATLIVALLVTSGITAGTFMKTFKGRRRSNGTGSSVSSRS